MPTFIRKAPNLYEFEGVRFYPGLNQVPDAIYEDWNKRCKKSFDEHFKRQLTGTDPAMVELKVEDEKPGQHAEDVSQLILKASPKKAVDLISKTLLLAPLEKALEQEKRKLVIEALEAQIAEIKRKPSADELLGGMKQSVAPPTGNLMDNLGIKHEHKEPDKY